MDETMLAERRYLDIVGGEIAEMDPAERYGQMPIDKLEAWLTHYVVPTIDEMLHRPRFRDCATWSQRALAPGAETEERAAVERVDNALCASAKSLSRFFEYQLVKRQLEAMETSALSSQPARLAGVLRPERLCAHIPYYAGQLKRMARRAWTDLVCLQDYLHPVGGMMYQPPSPAVADGTTVVSCWPELFPVGDCIVHCLIFRVEAWRSILAEARVLVYKALDGVGRSYSNQVAAEHEAWNELDQSIGRLRRLCSYGAEPPLRDACVTAVQVYAEFHPDPDLTALGLGEQMLGDFKGRLRQNIFGARDLETLDRIAAALGRLNRLYREMSPEMSQIDEAIAARGLVLIDRQTQREAYWEGDQIDADWFNQNKAWEMLLALAINARVRAAVEWVDLYRDHRAFDFPSTMSTRSERLRNLVPSKLAGHIRPGSRAASYRLSLPAEKIHVFSEKRVRR